MDKKFVTVIGSYNVGLFFKGQAIPKIGETVIGEEFYEGGGGKGSNQAVAASLMGAKTRFIGRLGNDKYGNDAIDMYKKLDIDTSAIKIDSGIHTGIGPIFIDSRGQNSIMVVPGANYNLSREDIDSMEDIIRDSCIVGFQLENRLDVVEYAIKKAHSLGVRTLLDPAPAARLTEDLYPFIYYIKPNEHEATVLTGIEVVDVKSAERAGRWFIERGVNTAIITLGEGGSVLVNDSKTQYFPAAEVVPLDTTGAGDCFSGAFMARLSDGGNVEDAIVFATCAAAISVTRLGVTDAIPNLNEVYEFIKRGSNNEKRDDRS